MTEYFPRDLSHGALCLAAAEPWCLATPYVAALVKDLTETIATEEDHRLKAALEHLLEVARNGLGVLDAYHGKPSLKSICAKGALVWGNVRPAGRIRTELERWFLRFRVGTDHTVTKQLGTKRAPSKMEEVRRYVRRCQTTGEQVPSDGHGRVDVEGAAFAMGKEYEWLRGNVQCMSVIKRALDLKIIQLGPTWQHPNPMTTGELNERVELICGFIRSCDEVGGALPRKVDRRGQVDFEYIRDAVGLTGSTHEREPRVAAAIKEVKARRGLRTPGEQLPDTWGCLLVEGLKQIEALKKHTKSVGVTLSAHKGVLEEIMRLNDSDAGIDDVVGGVFGDGFDKMVQTLIAGRSAGDAGNVGRAAKLWRTIHADERARNGLPPSFGVTLSILINRSGKTITAVAEEAGTTTYLIANLISGRLVVGADKREIVCRLAEALEVEHDVLLSRATGNTLKRYLLTPLCVGDQRITL